MKKYKAYKTYKSAAFAAIHETVAGPSLKLLSLVEKHGLEAIA